MKTSTRVFGLIGTPLGHSFSAGHFADKFIREGLAECEYLNFEIPMVDQVLTIISQNTDLLGLNVTIPYKKAVLPFLDEVDPVAQAIGAVNTIKIIRTGETFRLIGYNTDVTGFLRSIAEWEPGPGIRALVFGSGGSSLAIRYALADLGVAFQVVTRKPQAGEISYSDLTCEMAQDHRLWINCTPVGMHPNITGLLPLPWSVLTADHCLYDLVYNPCITGFLSMGLRAGAKTMNGRKMLIEQAEESWRIWNSQ